MKRSDECSQKRSSRLFIISNENVIKTSVFNIQDKTEISIICQLVFGSLKIFKLNSKVKILTKLMEIYKDSIVLNVSAEDRYCWRIVKFEIWKSFRMLFCHCNL